MALDEPEARHNRDLLMLLEWLHYFEATALFTFRHWRGEGPLKRDSIVDEGFNGLLHGTCGTAMIKVGVCDLTR